MSNQMSQREIALFNLGKSLVALLGEEQAITDLTLLYERHPEMFRDKEEVREVIERVVSAPEIIVDATHSNRDKGIYKAAARLNDRKMGDIVLKNTNGINEIFHANKKNIKEFERLQKQVEAGGRVAHFLHPDLKSAWAGSNEHSPASKKAVDGRDAHTPYTQAQSLDGRLVENNISSTTNTIIPNTKQQIQQELDKQLKSYLAAPSQHHRERHLANANAIATKAKDNNIALDSASLQKLKQYNNNEKNLSKSKGLHK